MLEILLFLFQNYLEKNVKGQENADSHQLTSQLEIAGFDPQEIQQAFDWFDQLNTLELTEEIKYSTAIRCFNHEEQMRLSVAARGFLQFLEQAKVIDPLLRELIIDRAMAIGQGEIKLKQIQWIVLMVLYNQPEQNAALAWVESHLLDSENTTLH